MGGGGVWPLAPFPLELENGFLIWGGEKNPGHTSHSSKAKKNVFGLNLFSVAGDLLANFVVQVLGHNELGLF